MLPPTAPDASHHRPGSKVTDRNRAAPPPSRAETSPDGKDHMYNP